MKDSLETIITSLVNNTSEVSINEIDGEKQVVFEVKVANSDMGKVIGKEGRYANAIRTLVQASSSLKDNKFVKIDIDKF